MNKPSNIVAQKKGNFCSKTLVSPNVYTDFLHTLGEEEESVNDEKGWQEHWDYSHLAHSYYDLHY